MSCTKTNVLLLFLSSFPFLCEMTVKYDGNNNKSPKNYFNFNISSILHGSHNVDYVKHHLVSKPKALSQMRDNTKVTGGPGYGNQKENNKYKFSMKEIHTKTNKRYKQAGHATEDSNTSEIYLPAKQKDEKTNAGEDSLEFFSPTKMKIRKENRILKLTTKLPMNRYLKKLTNFRESTNFKKVTKHIESSSKGIYVEPHMVKDDKEITQFTVHLYRQALKVFDSLKEKTGDDKIKHEIELLMQSYEDKFGDFITRTQNQQIKTRLGKQKVILNTLETSNRILSRLINYLIGKMGYSALRMGGTQALTNEANKTMIIENNHICKKFDICRSQDGLSNYLVNVFNIVLAANDNQLKELIDAWTEVLKYKDYSKIFHINTEKNYHKAITDIEKYPSSLLRPILLIVRNVILNRNKPIEVVGVADIRVNKTISFLEMIDAWDNALPPNEQNRLEWNDIQNSLIDWKDGRRKDILEIMESFVNNLYKGVHQFDASTRNAYDRNLNILMGSL